MQGYGKVSAVAKFSGVSVRTFRSWLKDPRLRRVVMPSGRILVKYRWVDQYLSHFEIKPDNTVGAIIDEVMEKLS